MWLTQPTQFLSLILFAPIGAEEGLNICCGEAHLTP